MRIITLSPKEPNEVIPVSFEFAKLVNTIDSVIITISVKKGIDASPAILMLGNAQIKDLIVTQLIQLGVDNTAYLIKAHITSGNLKYSLGAYLLVRLLK